MFVQSKEDNNIPEMFFHRSLPLTWTSSCRGRRCCTCSRGSFGEFCKDFFENPVTSEWMCSQETVSRMSLQYEEFGGGSLKICLDIWVRFVHNCDFGVFWILGIFDIVGGSLESCLDIKVHFVPNREFGIFWILWIFDIGGDSLESCLDIRVRFVPNRVFVLCLNQLYLKELKF